MSKKESVSILNHIQSNLKENGKLEKSAFKLPDEDRRYGSEVIRWAPGAIDGTFEHHTEANPIDADAEKVANMIRTIAETGEAAVKDKLQEILYNDSLLEFIDPCLQIIVEDEPPIAPYLYQYAQYLAFESSDRGAVKFGIALLGLIRDEADVENIMVLGRHDEFTLFACVAMTSYYEQPDEKIWILAQNVDGWGKIQAVERLTNTQNPAIKKWLILQGYKNTIMYEYLAYACAVTGDLKTELLAPVVENDVLEAAGEILEALLIGGPAEDMEVYYDGTVVTRLYLNKMSGYASTFSHFLVLQAIQIFLTDEGANWDVRRSMGWTEDFTSDLLIDLYQILSASKWKTLIEEKRNTNNDEEFWMVMQVANYVNIDLWDTLWQRLVEKPLDSGRWFNIMRKTDENRIDLVVDFALEHIPLVDIATGPQDEVGLSDKFAIHNCLDFILQELGAFPGKGVVLVMTGLRSPVVRNRNMAINALSDWDVEYWPLDVRVLLEEIEKIEPNEQTKERIQKLLDDGFVD